MHLLTPGYKCLAGRLPKDCKTLTSLALKPDTLLLTAKEADQQRTPGRSGSMKADRDG